MIDLITVDPPTETFSSSQSAVSVTFEPLTPRRHALGAALDVPANPLSLSVPVRARAISAEGAPNSPRSKGVLTSSSSSSSSSSSAHAHLVLDSARFSSATVEKKLSECFCTEALESVCLPLFLSTLSLSLFVPRQRHHDTSLPSLFFASAICLCLTKTLLVGVGCWWLMLVDVGWWNSLMSPNRWSATLRPSSSASSQRRRS